MWLEFSVFVFVIGFLFLFFSSTTSSTYLYSIFLLVCVCVLAGVPNVRSSGLQPIVGCLIWKYRELFIFMKTQESNSEYTAAQRHLTMPDLCDDALE